MNALRAGMAFLSFLLVMRSASKQDLPLALYWLMVFAYWVINFMEGIK